jgi:hypothetical protein
MPKPYSIDLRGRVIEDVATGASRREARLRRISDKIIATESAAVAAQPKQVAEPLVPLGEQHQ